MSAITVILIAAFGIDRVVAGLFFLLSFSAELRPLVIEDAAHPNRRASRARRLIYTLVAGYLGVVVVAGILKVHLFEMTQIAALGVPKPNPLLDTLLSGLIMAAGADRLSELVKSFGESGGKKGGGEKPIEITGKLVLEQNRSAGA
ncbi:MAG TPA: hypothetical protein VMG35_09060 [Bryobacteraceae bacterium]|nr:hypothetical protein [Bryobacteraceae bacterium]